MPTSIWAIRQDKLVRTEEGYVTSAARNTKVEAWEPKKIFNEVGDQVKEMTLKVGDSVRSGDTLAVLDDRVVFDELETERRAEENARTEVINAQRKVEDAPAQCRAGRGRPREGRAELRRQRPPQQAGAGRSRDGYPRARSGTW